MEYTAIVHYQFNDPAAEGQCIGTMLFEDKKVLKLPLIESNGVVTYDITFKPKKSECVAVLEAADSLSFELSGKPGESSNVMKPGEPDKNIVFGERIKIEKVHLLNGYFLIEPASGY